MERLHGIDAFSIYCETPSSPFATLKVALVEPTDPDTDTDTGVAGLLQLVKDLALDLGKGLIDRRVVRVPFNLHHPVWVVDPDFAVDDHLHRMALPAPGTKEQLCDLLSDLMGQPMDPHRPLWDVWLVEGCEGGRTAVVVKMHHVLADGRTVADLVTQVDRPARERPDSSEALEPGPPAEADRGIPGRARLLGGALVDIALTYFEELPGFLRNRKRVIEERSANAIGDPPDLRLEERPGSAPPCIFNAPFRGRYRVYRYETFPLGEFKSLSRLLGCTINVLVLGVVSEAVRRYLDDVDRSPDEPLVAAMPIGDSGGVYYSTRIHHEAPHNDVSVAFLPLHQGIEDMPERLRAIETSANAAVARVTQAWGRRFDNLLEFLPAPVVRQSLQMISRKQAKGRSAYANVLVSNVRGPRQEVRSPDGRWRLVELLSTGNITDQGHLNITVWSYVDNLSFSFYMRKGAVPEPDKLPSYVREVVGELRGLLEEAPAFDEEAVLDEEAVFARGSSAT